MPSGCKPLIIFEKAERPTGVRYVHVLNDFKTWNLSKYPEVRNEGNHKKFNKSFKFTFQQSGAPCHTRDEFEKDCAFRKTVEKESYYQKRSNS